MITIRNTQRTVPINMRLLRKEAEGILAILHYNDYDLGIWITNNRTIRSYNKTYRNKDKATDILSFAYYPNLRAGQRIKPTSEEDKNLGDLIISAQYVANQAEEYRVNFEQRMRVLLVHGICHLLGYDHIEDADYRRMRAKEAFILREMDVWER
jgi:probable rRNA maturation factor